MTEMERLLAGKLFNPGDPDLVKIKRWAHNLSQEYSMTLEDAREKRQDILHRLLKSCGNNVYFQGPIYFNYGIHTSIGNNFFGNYNIMISDDALVTIGNNVMMGPNCTIATPGHPVCPDERNGITGANGEFYGGCYAKPVVIGDDVWFGAGVIVCPGVTIGSGCVIGAGSVVTHDIPQNSVAAGNPCRVIREISEKDKMENFPDML